MVAARPARPSPRDRTCEEGRVLLVLESERLRSLRRARVRLGAALLLCSVLSISFAQLFLPRGIAFRTGGTSAEWVVFAVAVAVVHLIAGGVLGWWSRSRSHVVAGFALAVLAALAACTGACTLVLMALDPDDGRQRVERWFGPSPPRHPPAVGPETVASLRPALVVLLLVVLPVLLTGIGAVLTRRDRLRLERLEDDVRLTGGDPARLPGSGESSTENADLARWAAEARAHADRGPRTRLGRPVARVRTRVLVALVALVTLAVHLLAMPRAAGFRPADLGGTVYLLTAGFTALAAFLILHGWARTRSASRRGLVGALLGAATIGAAGWWLTSSVIAGVHLRPDGLGYLADPELVAELDSLYAAPALVVHRSWQQSVLLALPYLVPVVLAAWSARRDRRDWEALRRREGKTPSGAASGTVAGAWAARRAPAQPAADPWEDGR